MSFNLLASNGNGLLGTPPSMPGTPTETRDHTATAITSPEQDHGDCTGSTQTLALVHAQVETLSAKAVKKSGNRFFTTVQNRTRDFLLRVSKSELDEDSFEEVRELLTPGNLVLIARLYAGELNKPTRKRNGVCTLYDTANALLRNDAAAVCFNAYVLATTLEAAEIECEQRACDAMDKEEHWSTCISEPVDWDERTEAIEAVLEGWQAVRKAVTDMNWEEVLTQLNDLLEIEA